MKGFPGGGAGGLQSLLKQAQKMQVELKKAQDDVQTITAEGSSGGGAVTVIVNGKFEIQKLEISPSVIAVEDKDMLQDLVIASVNEAVRKAQVLVQERMQKATGGMSIPGMF